MIASYIELCKVLKDKDYDTALPLAKDLLKRMQDSGSIFGWNRLAMTGNSELDKVLTSLDRHLTGPRT